jgi:hypothetical protein
VTPALLKTDLLEEPLFVGLSLGIARIVCVERKNRSRLPE